MVAADDAPVQFIVNSIVDLLKVDAALRELDFHCTPNYNVVTFNKPSCHVFALQRQVEQFSPDSYRSVLQLAVQLQLPSAEQNSKERVIHKYEKSIHDILTTNAQVQDTASTDFGWQETRVLGIDYTVLGDGQSAIDELLFQVEVEFVEVIC